MQGRLTVSLLGNYQVQEEKRSYEGNTFNKVACKDAEMQIFLRRPTSYPDWIAEYDMGAKRLDRLQEVMASLDNGFLNKVQRKKYEQQEKTFVQ